MEPLIAQQTTKKHSRAGITSMIFGSILMITIMGPRVGIYFIELSAVPFGVLFFLTVILSIVGLSSKNMHKTTAIIGLIMSFISLIYISLYIFVTGSNALL